MRFNNNRFSAPAVAETHSNSIDLPHRLSLSKPVVALRPSEGQYRELAHSVVLTWTNETGWVDQNSNRECRNLTDISIS